MLAAGDYLLWNWSLQGGHDVPALISGLTLTPLAIALIWLLALNAVRLLGWITQRRRAGTARRGATVAEGARKDLRGGAQASRAGDVAMARAEGERPSSSSKLAA